MDDVELSALPIPPDQLLLAMSPHEALAVAVIRSALQSIGRDWLTEDCGRWWCYVSGLDRQILWERAGGEGRVPTVHWCSRAFDLMPEDIRHGKLEGFLLDV